MDFAPGYPQLRNAAVPSPASQAPWVHDTPQHDHPRPAAAPGTPRQGQYPGGTLDTRIPPRRVRIGSPTSLLAVIPVLLGFDPGHSIVVIGTEPGTALVRITLRYNVPDPRHPRLAAALAEHAISLLAGQGVTTAVAAGYGTDAAVSPVAAALRERAAAAGIAMTELLRADNGRYWSFICRDPECCPPEGTPFDVTDHPAARALRDAGGRVLADRDALAATVAAVGGQEGAAMRRATRRYVAEAAKCAARLTAPACTSPCPGSWPQSGRWRSSTPSGAIVPAGWFPPSTPPCSPSHSARCESVTTPGRGWTPGSGARTCGCGPT